MRFAAISAVLLVAVAASAQDAMHIHAPAQPSTQLVVTGLDGKSLTYSADDVKNMTHLTVTVHNTHNNQDETYSGVPVSAFLKRAEPALATGATPHASPRTTVLLFGATDNFRVVLTECDVDPACHNGVVLIADQLASQPLTTDGAFKLIITEDKKPARWARNLNSIALRNVQ